MPPWSACVPPERCSEKVGRQFSVIRERVRQIEAKALRKLKHPSRSRKLRTFLDNENQHTSVIMSTVRRTFDLDEDPDARLTRLETERGQDATEVVADAVALLVSTIAIDDMAIEKDLRRLREFERIGEAIPGEDMMAWVNSWGTENELPPPRPRKVQRAPRAW